MRKNNGPSTRFARSGQAGFTLIEITFAVLILCASLVTLLSLQYATLQREYRDVNLQRAMLISRRVLSRLEIEEAPLEKQNKHLTVPDLLDIYAPEDVKKGEDTTPEQSFADMDADFTVQDWILPGTGEQEIRMRKLTLRIIWGPGELDFFETSYFVPTDAIRNNTGDANEETG